MSRDMKAVISHISDDPAEILDIIEKSRYYPQMKQKAEESELPFPFHREMLKLLKQSNPLQQKYYYLEDETHYAFFCSYMNRMDLFTFGKAQLFIKLQTIAFPCSLSCGGYITNDIAWMLEYIKTIKGCKLVLNIDKAVNVKGMAFGETLPTCRLALRDEHVSLQAYMDSLRSQYRRRMKLAVKRCGDINIKKISDDSISVHPMYLQTFEKSEYKLECLEKEFFDRSEGEKLVFIKDGEPQGFVLLKKNGDELVFMLCGMNYKDEGCNADLYYYMLLNIVGYAIEHKCRYIDFGQTSEKTKLKFGAVLEKRYFYAHHSNPLINLLAMAGRRMLEYTYAFPDFRVFK